MKKSSPHADTPHVAVAAGIIWQDGLFLAARRPMGKPRGGLWEFPGGKQEPGESMESAVRREVAEETAVQIGSVTYLASQPWAFPANLMLGCRATATSTAITLDPAELEDALWLGREELAQVFSGHHPTIKASRPGSIAQFILNRWLADTLD